MPPIFFALAKWLKQKSFFETEEFASTNTFVNFVCLGANKRLGSLIKFTGRFLSIMQWHLGAICIILLVQIKDLRVHSNSPKANSQ